MQVQASAQSRCNRMSFRSRTSTSFRCAPFHARLPRQAKPLPGAQAPALPGRKNYCTYSLPFRPAEQNAGRPVLAPKDAVYLTCLEIQKIRLLPASLFAVTPAQGKVIFHPIKNPKDYGIKTHRGAAGVPGAGAGQHTMAG